MLHCPGTRIQTFQTRRKCREKEPIVKVRHAHFVMRTSTAARSGASSAKTAAEKIAGLSEFRGKADESVFCGRWDTRL